MADIVMPRLSDTMEEGTILRWLKGEGETVARGEELVEIETDKATMTYESDQAGVLRLLAAEGDTLAVGQPIATVGDGHGDEAAGAPQGGTAAPQGGTATPEADTGTPRGGAPGGGTAGERVRASPLARRMAREGGIELAGLHGSGPGGRIVKADVLRPAPAARASAGAPAAQGPAGTAPWAPDEIARAKGETRVLELTRLQQTVARRMAESKATIPDFTLEIELDMEECVALRAQLKEIANPAAAGTPYRGTGCLLYTSPSPRDRTRSRMPSSA